MTSMTDSPLPSRADLDAATARTAAAMANPAARPSDRLLAATAEEAVHLAYLQRPGAEAELRAEAEAGVGKLTGTPAEGGARWPEDQPVPYTLTAKGRSAAHRLERKTRAVRRSRTPHRLWALTAKAEALLAAEDGPEQTS
jgi:hypothetical protein